MLCQFERVIVFSHRKEVTSSSRFAVNMVAQFKEHGKVFFRFSGIFVYYRFFSVDLTFLDPRCYRSLGMSISSSDDV